MANILKTKIDAIYDACIAAKEQVLNSFSKWQHQRYLNKMGWTEEAFQRQTDPDVNLRADRVTQFYHGYPHVYVFTSSREDPFTRYMSWIEGYNAIAAWCDANCKGKVRHDIMRVHKQTGLKQVDNGIDWIEEPEWFINDIGGGDALFFAFKDSKDYSTFLLKWA